MIQNSQNAALQGLAKDYFGSNNRSDFNDPGYEWSLYGKRLPFEFGEKLHKTGKRGHLVFQNERPISGSRIAPQVIVP